VVVEDQDTVKKLSNADNAYISFLAPAATFKLVAKGIDVSKLTENEITSLLVTYYMESPRSYTRRSGGTIEAKKLHQSMQYALCTIRNNSVMKWGLKQSIYFFNIYIIYI
jgi:hypothetical protein